MIDLILKSNVVMGYSAGNQMELDALPDDFYPGKYLFDGAKFMLNPDFVESTATDQPIGSNDPSPAQQVIMGLSKNVMSLQAMVMAQNQQLAQLMAKEGN